MQSFEAQNVNLSAISNGFINREVKRSRIKVYLHVGLPKTGSSFLQARLQVEFGLNIHKQLFYPPSDVFSEPGTVSSGNLGGIANICGKAWSRSELRSEIALQSFKLHLQNAAGDLIFSSESFYSNRGYDKDSINEFLSLIDEAKFELIFILFLRDPVDLAVSLWVQGVKRHFSEPIDIESYLDKFNLGFIDFLKAYGIGDQKNKCIVLNYDNHKSDLISALFAELGIELNKSSEFKIINRSLSLFEVEVMQSLTRICVTSNINQNYIVGIKTLITDEFLKRTVISQKPFISNESRKNFLLKNLKDIDSIEKLINQKIVIDNNLKYIAPYAEKTNGEASKVIDDLFRTLIRTYLSAYRPNNPVHFSILDKKTFVGFKERVVDGYLYGWCYCEQYPQSPVLIELVAADNTRYFAVANTIREDVVMSGHVGGLYSGFSVKVFDNESLGDINQQNYRLEKLRVSVFGTSFLLPALDNVAPLFLPIHDALYKVAAVSEEDVGYLRKTCISPSSVMGPTTGLFQVFWTEAEGENSKFSESSAHSVSVEIDGDEIETSLFAPVGKGPFGVLVFPPDMVSVVTLRAIRLITVSGDVLWCWDGNLDALKNISGMVVSPSGGDSVFTCICLNSEPKFEITIPSGFFDCTSSTLKLIFKIKAESLERGLPRLLKFAASNNGASPQSRLSQSIDSLTSMIVSSLASRDKIISQQRYQLNQMRIEFLRAEAQLDLLKDLILRGQEEDRL